MELTLNLLPTLMRASFLVIPLSPNRSSRSGGDALQSYIHEGDGHLQR